MGAWWLARIGHPPASVCSLVEKGREQSSISRHLDFLLRKPLVPSLEFEPRLFTGTAEQS